MRRYRVWAVLSLVPAVALWVTGCGDKGDTPKAGPGPQGKTSKPGEQSGTPGKTGSASAERTALKGTGVASLKGKVTFDGDPPKPKDLKPDMEKQQDKDHCLKGPTLDPTWMVGADKGVANVVVWLRAPEGHYFDIPAADQSRTKEVIMDQPFCEFQPHVVAFNPYFWDPASKKLKPTGEKFRVENSAPIPHNTAFTPTQKLVNTGKNEILKPKANMPIDARPGPDTQPGGEELLNINCDIHKWMTAKALVFDHPYFAVTNDKGEYEIKGAPAGAEVLLAYWHETFPGNNLRTMAKTEKITLKEGANTKDLKVK
jgi:hypothetical protein